MVRAFMIVEMAGRPAEHVKDSLEKHVGVLEKIKDVEVHSIKVHDTKEVVADKSENKSEPLFTTFAEIDFECVNFARLSEIMFDFMPSSIEVTEPPQLTMNLNESTGLLNTISGRFHKYDEFARVLNVRYKKLEEQLKLAEKIFIEKDAEIARLKKEKSKKKTSKSKKNN